MGKEIKYFIFNNKLFNYLFCKKKFNNKLGSK